MDKQRKHQIVIKICCILAAFSLWLYISNVQNPNISYTLRKVPVELKNIDSLSQYGLVVKQKEGYYVDLRIQGRASEVYNVKASDFKIVADVGPFVVKKGINKIPVEIKQSPDSISILDSGNLWIKMDLDQFVEKTITVKLNVKGNTSLGNRVDNISINPKEVKVKGPSTYVNSVQRVGADVDISNLSKNKVIDLNVKALDSEGSKVSNVTVEPNTVQVSISVQNSKSLPIKVNTTGKLPDNLILKEVLPKVSKVNIMGDNDTISNLQAIETETLDLTTISNSTIKELNLKIPEGIKILDNKNTVSVEVRVERIVEKNISADINMINKNKDYDYSLDKGKVYLILSGTEQDINTVVVSDISGSIDLNNMIEGEYIIPINIKLPDKLKLVSSNPTKVKVKISKKQTEEKNANTGQ